MATTEHTVLAWKDPAYRAHLSAEELAQLPPNPAGPTWYDLDTHERGQLLGAPVKALPPWSFGTGTLSDCSSCGYFCTATTECPIMSFCC